RHELFRETTGNLFGVGQQQALELGDVLERAAVRQLVTRVDRLPEAEAVRSQILGERTEDRKSTRLNSSHSQNSYAAFCLKKKNHNRPARFERTEEHTSELHSLSYLVCRLFPETQRSR